MAGNNVAALGNRGDVNTELYYYAVCINCRLEAVNVSTRTCRTLVAPAVLVDHGLIRTTECGELLGGSLHRAGVALLGGVDVIVRADHGTAEAYVVEAYHLDLIAHEEELIRLKELTVAGAVGRKNEAVVRNNGAGVIALTEGTEADYLECLFFKVVLANKLGAEGVSARLFTKLIVVVNYHGARTVCVGVIDGDSLVA